MLLALAISSGRSFSRRCFLGFIMICFGARGADPGDAAPPFVSAHEVNLPLWDLEKRALAGTVRIGKIRRDFERKGFFRIGALPLVIAENIAISLVDAPTFRRGLEATERVVAEPGAAPALEFRGFELKTPGVGEPLVTAAGAKLRPGRGFDLQEVRWYSTNGVIELPSARLVVADARLQLLSKNGGTNRIFEIHFPIPTQPLVPTKP